MTRVFRYIVRYDCGFAPNPFHGLCTLATCKPSIRERADIGDWVIGFGSLSAISADNLVYAMQVDEKVKFDEYWRDERFYRKRPRYDGSLKQAYGDNIYHKKHGEWCQANSHHSRRGGAPNESHILRDTSSEQVLISRRFSYFGEAAISAPAGLELIPTNRRNFSYIHDPYVRVETVRWLEGLPRGCMGRPADWP